MPQINLLDLYSAMQKEMMSTLHAGTVAVIHSGTKGDNTEYNWINWFKAYLPNRYKVDKAIIIDSTGQQSEQIDLVIYDAQYSYLVFNQNNTKVIPAESVYAVFEVKQNLNKAHINMAAKKAKSVRTLTRTSAQIISASGIIPPKTLHEIPSGILTTRSDWSDPIINNIVDCTSSLEKNEQLNFICAIDSNTFVIDQDTSHISYCEEKYSLVYLLLNLLKKLQDIGTVPAIDFSQYASCIPKDIHPMDN